MVKVGVRDLRQNLSQYVNIARAGQAVVITERGKAIAQLVPAGADMEERVQALQAAGMIRWRGGKLAMTRPVARLRGKRQVSDLVVEMRQ
jgi:prevent-host-death family protein